MPALLSPPCPEAQQAIEPTFGHMKIDGLLAHNWLKGSDGDAFYTVLCGAGQNVRLILAHLRVLLLALIAMLVLGSVSGVPAGRTARSVT